MIRPILAAGCVAVLAGCWMPTIRGAKIVPPASPSAVSYACESGPALSVIYHPEGGTATVAQLGLGTEVLMAVPSGSGFAYERIGYSLRGQGEEVIWGTPASAPVRCTAQGVDD